MGSRRKALQMSENAAIKELFGDELPDNYLPCDDIPELTSTQANRIVGIIKQERDAIGKIQEQEQSEREFIKLRAEVLSEAHNNRIEYLLDHYSDMLEKFTAVELTEKARSVKLLYGTLGFRKSPATLEVTDENALMAWAKANLPDAVKTVETILKTPVKDHVEATGEIPDGASYIKGVDKFYIS